MAVNDSIETILKDFSQHLFARQGLAESTITGYVSTIRRLSPILGERPEHKTIEQFVTDLRRRGASYSHVKNTSQALERYTDFMGNPIRLGRPKKPKPLVKNTLSEPEVTLLIAAARGIRDRALVSLLAYSGLRNKEICSLLIRDIDVAGQLVHVRGGKGDKDRSACVAGSCIESLITYLHQRNAAPGDRLFVTKRNQNPLAPQDLRKIVRLTAARAGIRKRVHPHLLRHSLATNMLHRGANLLSIKDQLGHAFVETTMIYLHSAPKRMQMEYRMFAPSYM